MESIKLTDWIQAIGSIIAALVALCAFYIARQTLHAPYRTIVKPVSILSDSNFLRNGIRINNAGPGIACRVTIQHTSLTGLDKDDLRYNLFITEGEEIIQPKESQDFWSSTDVRFVIQLPFMIKYQTLTGKSYKELWRYNSKGSFSKVRFLDSIRFKFMFLIFRNQVPLRIFKNNTR